MLINNAPTISCPSCHSAPVEQTLYALNERGERIPLPDMRQAWAGFIVGDIVMLLAVGVLALVWLAPQLQLKADVSIFSLTALVSLAFTARSAYLLWRRRFLVRNGSVNEFRCPNCQHIWSA